MILNIPEKTVKTPSWAAPTHIASQLKSPPCLLHTYSECLFVGLHCFSLQKTHIQHSCEYMFWSHEAFLFFHLSRFSPTSKGGCVHVSDNLPVDHCVSSLMSQSTFSFKVCSLCGVLFRNISMLFLRLIISAFNFCFQFRCNAYDFLPLISASFWLFFSLHFSTFVFHACCHLLNFHLLHLLNFEPSESSTTPHPTLC